MTASLLVKYVSANKIPSPTLVLHSAKWNVMFSFVFFSPHSISLTVLFYVASTMSFFPWELIFLSSSFLRLQNIIYLNFRNDSSQGGSWFGIYCPRKSLVILIFPYSSLRKKTFIVPIYEFISPSSYIYKVSNFCLLLQLRVYI